MNELEIEFYYDQLLQTFFSQYLNILNKLQYNILFSLIKMFKSEIMI